MYQVSFNSLLYFQRCAAEKLFIAKVTKGSNSENTVYRVMVLELCNSLHGPLSVYHVSLNSLLYFQRYEVSKSFEPQAFSPFR